MAPRLLSDVTLSGFDMSRDPYRYMVTSIMHDDEIMWHQETFDTQEEATNKFVDYVNRKAKGKLVSTKTLLLSAESDNRLVTLMRYNYTSGLYVNGRRISHSCPPDTKRK